MKRLLPSLILATVAGFFLAPVPGRADAQLSAENLDIADHWGLFTPGFKVEVHKLVETKQAIVEAKKEEKDLNQQLPDLQKQATDAEAKVTGLRQELAEYDHGDEADFTELQKKMNDAAARPQEQLALAQAYVWAYPASPHQTEAQQYLQQAQKKLADQAQAEKDAEAARADARAKLLQRVQARDLSLAEWRDFLRDMSQEDLVKYLGRPQSQTADYWIYSGDWTEDPATHQKAGLQINFNAARVMSVSEVPHS